MFVDVQKKLDSLGQRTKTHEVQLANMYEETGERFEHMAASALATKKEATKVCVNAVEVCVHFD